MCVMQAVHTVALPNDAVNTFLPPSIALLSRVGTPLLSPLVVVLFFLLHLHSPHISMQVMARAENTVFLRVEVKETNLEIFSVYAFTAKKIAG